MKYPAVLSPHQASAGLMMLAAAGGMTTKVHIGQPGVLPESAGPVAALAAVLRKPPSL
jgi:hypothetical protein